MESSYSEVNVIGVQMALAHLTIQINVNLNPFSNLRVLKVMKHASKVRLKYRRGFTLYLPDLKLAGKLVEIPYDSFSF